MFIIAGVRQRRWEYDNAENALCARCHNDVTWKLVRMQTWATLFFLPIFPIGASSYYVVCPICGNAIACTKEEFEIRRARSQSGRDERG